jgi:nucleolar GTP-binding protein
VPRDGVKREAFIPEAVKTRRAYDKNDPERRQLERDLEEEQGGAGVYSMDQNSASLPLSLPQSRRCLLDFPAERYLIKDEWKYDIMPEIQDGKNVADFIDPDIMSKLEELEAEEERLEKAGFYDSESEDDSDVEAVRTAASTIRDKKAMIRLKNLDKGKAQNRPIIPRRDQARTLSDMTATLKEAGYDPSTLEERATLLAKARGLVGRKRGAGDMDFDGEEDEEEAWGSEGEDEEGDESMEVDGDEQANKKRRTSGVTSIVSKGKRVPKTDRQTAGLKDDGGVQNDKVRFSFLPSFFPSLGVTDVPVLLSTALSTPSPSPNRLRLSV